MEDCSLAAHRAVAVASGLAVAPVPVDDHGADVSRLGDAGAVLLTPAHQFPLGAALAPERRSRVVEWAAASGGLVIEDDYDGEFRYDRQPVGALQALAPEHVVYGGTASKSLAPGLRLGWLVLPARLMDDMIAAKELVDRGTSGFDQLTLAAFIGSGGYDRQVRRSRLTYRRRRDQLVTALRQHAPAVQVAGITAGLHLLLRLPAGQTEDAVIARAAGLGLALEGLGAYPAPGGPHPQALVAGYGTPPEHAFTGAVDRLTAALAR